MAERNEVRIVITGDAAGAKAALEGVRRTTTSLGSTLASFAKQAVAVAAGFAGWAGIQATFRAVAGAAIGVNAQLEQSAIAFRVLTGSAAEADKIVRQLYEYAAKTPFRFEEIQRAALIIRGARLEWEKWGPVLGDAAAAGQAAGLTFDQVAMAIARVQAGNVGEFFERVGAVLGITRQELAKLGVQFEESGALADRSARGIARTMDAIHTIMTQKFGGMAEAQSRTFAGMTSTLLDNANMIIARVFEPMFYWLKNRVLPALLELADRFSEAFEKGGLLAGLKAIIPPEWAPALESTAWLLRTVRDAFSAIFGFIRDNAEPIKAALVGIAAGFAAMKVAEVAAGAMNLFRAATLAKLPVISQAMKAIGQYRLEMSLFAIQTGRAPGILAKVSGAFSAFSKAIFGVNPLVLGITAAVAGLAATAYVLWKNWNTVGPFFQSLWEFVRAAFERGASAVALALRYMQLSSAEATAAIRRAITSMVEHIFNVMEPITRILPASWQQALEDMKGAMQRWVDRAENDVARARNALAEAQAQSRQATSNMAAAWEDLRAKSSVAWADIKDTVASAAQGVISNLGFLRQKGDEVSAGFEEVKNSASAASPALDNFGASASRAKESTDKLSAALQQLDINHKYWLATAGQSATEAEKAAAAEEVLRAKMALVNQEMQSAQAELARVAIAKGMNSASAMALKQRIVELHDTYSNLVNELRRVREEAEATAKAQTKLAGQAGVVWAKTMEQWYRLPEVRAVVSWEEMRSYATSVVKETLGTAALEAAWKEIQRTYYAATPEVQRRMFEWQYGQPPPGLQYGGILTRMMYLLDPLRGGLWRIAERGPEAVIPLDRSGTMIDYRKMADAVAQALSRRPQVLQAQVHVHANDVDEVRKIVTLFERLPQVARAMGV